MTSTLKLYSETGFTLRIGYRYHDFTLYSLTLVKKDVLSFTVPSSCTYRQTCTISWTSSNPYTTASIYFVVTGGVSGYPIRRNGVIYDSYTPGVPLNASLASDFSRVGPGSITFTPLLANNGLYFGTWWFYAIVDDDPGDVIRDKMQPITIICKPLYYGTTCDTKQSITQSMIVGGVVTIFTLLLTCIVMWGDWLRRWSEKIRYFVTERAVSAVRYRPTST